MSKIKPTIQLVTRKAKDGNCSPAISCPPSRLDEAPQDEDQRGVVTDERQPSART
jgi:hypothetical protein